MPGGRELDHPVVAGVRDPDVARRVGGHALGLVKSTETGHQVTSLGELRDLVVAGVRDPYIAVRGEGDAVRIGQRLLPERLPESRRVRQRAGS